MAVGNNVVENPFARYDKLPKMRFSGIDAVQRLPEYSASLPTGITLGKTWRRHDGAFDPSCKNPVWLIGVYERAPSRWECSGRSVGSIFTCDRTRVPCPNCRQVDMVQVVYYRPVIAVRGGRREVA